MEKEQFWSRGFTVYSTFGKPTFT